MKTKSILTLALALSLSAASLWAQDFQTTRKTGVTPAKKETERPAPGQPLPPKATGVVVMMSEKGLQVINPCASKDAGDGRKNITASYVLNPRPSTYEDEKPYGGVNIFGWEF